MSFPSSPSLEVQGGDLYHGHATDILHFSSLSQEPAPSASFSSSPAVWISFSSVCGRVMRHFLWRTECICCPTDCRLLQVTVLNWCLDCYAGWHAVFLTLGGKEEQESGLGQLRMIPAPECFLVVIMEGFGLNNYFCSFPIAETGIGLGWPLHLTWPDLIC